MSLVISSRPPSYVGNGKGSMKDFSAYPHTDTSKLTTSNSLAYSLEFDGTSSAVTTGSSAERIGIASSWTWECWLKLKAYSAGNAAVLVSNRGGASGGRLIYVVGEAQGNKRKIALDINDAALSQEAVGITQLNLGSWYHIGVSFKYNGGGANECRIYVNGLLDSVTTGVADIAPPNTAEIDWFGYESGGSANFHLTGYLTQIRYWNVVRTADQILSNMNLTLRGFESGLVGYYPFFEGSGGQAKDYSRSAINGTLASALWSIDSPLRNNSIAEVLFGAQAEVTSMYNAIIANSGSISAQSLFAANELVKDLKRYGVWDKIDDMGLFIGDNLAAALTKIKFSQGQRYLANHNFVQSDYVERGSTGGLLGLAASTKYLDTGHNVSGLDGSNTSASVYSPLYSGVGVEFGEDQLNRYTLFPGSGNLGLFTAGVYTTGRTIAGGLFGGSRLPGTNLSASMNGDFSTNVTADGPAALFNENCYLFARNENGTATNPSSTRLNFYHIGKGFTQTEWGNFYTAVQKFQRSMARHFGT